MDLSGGGQSVSPMLEKMNKRGDETAKETGELELIRRIRARTARLRMGIGVRSGVVLGIGDDCALLKVRPGEEVAVTTDLSIEGRHFRVDWHEPEAVGHRTLARGLSDLAAMGARPVAAFVSLGLRREMAGGRDEWVKRFYEGLLKLAGEHDVPLAGGDLAESPVVLADVVLVGAAPRGKALRRSGARAGDAIYVTGELGGAAAGLAMLGSLEFAVRRSEHGKSAGAVAGAFISAAEGGAGAVAAKTRRGDGGDRRERWAFDGPEAHLRGVGSGGGVGGGSAADRRWRDAGAGARRRRGLRTAVYGGGGDADSADDCGSAGDADWADGAAAQRAGTDYDEGRGWQDEGARTDGMAAFCVRGLVVPILQTKCARRSEWAG